MKFSPVSLKTISMVALCMVPLLILFLFRITTSYQFDNDFGRDLVDIQSIADGNIRLLGPKLSFGGIHSGPYYYYLFAPLVILFPDTPESLLIANALLSWLALVAAGVALIALWRFSLPASVAAVYWIGTTSYLLYSARGPGNAFTYVAWLFVLMLVWPAILKYKKLWLFAGYGLLWGIAINFHFITGVLLASFLLATACMTILSKKSTFSALPWLQYGAVFIGVVLAFTPFFLFEVTHDFVQLKNTFIDKSYQAFTDNQNLIAAPQTSSNPLLNSLLLARFAQGWLPFAWAGVLLSTGLLFSKKIRSTPASVYLLASVLTTVIMICIATSQIAIHYFFPLYVAIQVGLILAAQELLTPKVFLVVFGIGIVVNTVLFPQHFYAPSSRPIERFRTLVDQIATQSELQSLSTQPFAVYVTRETPLAPQGFEYRYFLGQRGLVSVEPNAYNQAEQLVWFAEDPSIDFASVSSWELDQFGPRVAVSTPSASPTLVTIFSRAAAPTQLEE